MVTQLRAWLESECSFPSSGSAKSSGRLEPGKQIKWDWEMYNASVQVDVKAIEENKRILVEWSAYDAPTTVEWVFTPRADNTTFVSITNVGFSGEGDEAIKQAISSTEGFTLVLAGLKALLEHKLNLNLVADRFPADPVSLAHQTRA